MRHDTPSELFCRAYDDCGVFCRHMDPPSSRFIPFERSMIVAIRTEAERYELRTHGTCRVRTVGGVADGVVLRRADAVAAGLRLRPSPFTLFSIMR